MRCSIGVQTLTPGNLGNYRSHTKMSNTKVVYINFPYILTPVPTLYSSPKYDQKQIFDLSVTYDLDLWTKILKIILHNENSTSNMYVKFQNNWHYQVPTGYTRRQKYWENKVARIPSLTPISKWIHFGKLCSLVFLWHNIVPNLNTAPIIALLMIGTLLTKVYVHCIIVWTIVLPLRISQIVHPTVAHSTEGISGD